uniref:DUF4371 domain-containing protein n=1 Tax=Latimeria chalumnae TaxID=7897 RepID=H3A771_LATCH
WLQYLQEQDSAVCFYCATAVQQKMPLTNYIDDTFTKAGFSNWQKAKLKFSKHEQSGFHKNAVEMVTKFHKNKKSIREILSAEYEEERNDNRKALMAILTSMQFLSQQGLPLRGVYINNEENAESGELNSNIHQLLRLRASNIPMLTIWLKKSQDKFTRPQIQNEVMEIMAHEILRKIASRFSGCKFSVMVDESTGISNAEQLVFCLRYVDDDLNTHEEFIGMHSLESTSAASITNTIEGIMLRMSIQLKDCRGQCYDGASSMAGCKTGVVTSLLSKEPRALYTHCYGHALNLAVQETVKKNHILRDTLDTIEEMMKLIKKSPKRETIFNKRGSKYHANDS